MALRFVKDGILNTVQDLGRFGHRRQGINPNGAMDTTALRILNALLGNDDGEAAIELHYPAGEIEFLSPCTFCIAGADFCPHLDGILIDNWRTYHVGDGSVLSFAKRSSGQRAYLGVSGGFCIKYWLGSASTNLAVGVGGLAGRSIAASERIEFKRPDAVMRSDLSVGNTLIPRYRNTSALRVTIGAEFDRLTPLSVESLFTEFFRITPESNRMGYRLAGRNLDLLSELQMVSTAVGFGTIQLLPNGQMVILMADHQTTGGYPRLGNITRRDTSLVAQLGPSDRVSFAPVSLEQAEEIDMDLERQIAFLKVGRKLRTDK